MLIAYPTLGNEGYGILLIFISASFLSQTNMILRWFETSTSFLFLIIGILRRGYYRKKSREQGAKEEEERSHREGDRGTFSRL
jgi:hypothetical protein